MGGKDTKGAAVPQEPRRNRLRMSEPLHRFWVGLLVCSGPSVLYPVALFWSVPTVDDFWYYLSIELSWSFSAILILPLAGALFATTMDPRVLLMWSWWRRRALSAVIGLGVVLIAVAVWKDIDSIPNPDRVRQSTNPAFQRDLIALDRRLRDTRSFAKPVDLVASIPRVVACRAAEPAVLSKTTKVSADKAGTVEDWSYHKHLYYCGLRDLLTQNGLASTAPVYDGASRTPVAYVAALLNFVFGAIIWSTLCWIIFLALFHLRDVRKAVIYVFVSWMVVISLWFPTRLYSEWQWWYGDLRHVAVAYPAFIVLLTVAVILATLLAVWLWIRSGKDPGAVMGSVYGLISTVCTVLGLFYTEVIAAGFGIFSSLDGVFLVLLGCVVTAVLAVYAKAVVDGLSRDDPPASLSIQ